MRTSGRTVMSSAFTLIELLIVVAIIAILAAIAVPNFLEAQTRAKVSRVKADTRSLATAIETYALDNNGKYSLAYGRDNVLGGAGSDSAWIRYACRTLTTPIAYLTSLPLDPFIPTTALDIISPSSGGSPSYVYQWYDVNDPHKYHSGYPIYYSNPSSIYYPSFKLCIGTLTSPMWILVSQGPFFLKASNGRSPSEFVDWKVMPYDASNGTMSRGIITRTSTKA
jgi:prepilin-type N-terminal cleavage/methylation domain-containing protein